MSAVHETWVMPIAPIRVSEGVECDPERGVDVASSTTGGAGTL